MSDQSTYAGDWVIEFRDGTFFQNLEAEHGGPIETAQRFASKEAVDNFEEEHGWLLVYGSMALCKPDHRVALRSHLIDIGESSAAPSERDPRDFYPTPHEVTRALVPSLPPYKTALDIGCGTGAILDVLGAMRPAVRTLGVELDPELARRADDRGHHVWIGDVTKPVDFCHEPVRDTLFAYTLQQLGEEADVIVMNPPFKHAQAFVETAMAIRKTWVTVAVLLRGTFLEGIERLDFHRKYPAEILVIPNRIDFTRGRVRDCPTCDGTGVVPKPQPRKPTSKIDPHRCDGCAGKRYVKGGVDSAAVYWWVFRPELRVGTYRHLDPIVVPRLEAAS